MDFKRKHFILETDIKEDNIQISAVSQKFNFSFQIEKFNNDKESKKSDSLFNKESYIVSLSNVDVTYSAGKKESKNDVKQIDAEDKPKNLAEIKEEIRNEIKQQTIQLLTKYLNEVPEVKSSLREFFINNPEALKNIAAGKIPEYFNVENTAKRILDIYFSRYDGGDREEFAENASEIINQAYTEVEQLVGALPDIVLQTKEKVFEILNKFRNGEDVSDFVNIPDINAPVN